MAAPVSPETLTEHSGGFSLSLGNFDGPFDLLLSLISKHELDITEISLSIVTDEFIAFIQLSSMPVNSLSEHSRLITIYALAGFANLASIGIQISGIGTMAPERRGDLAQLAWPAFVAATLASCMTGCVVGIVAG